jgi:hypothetical protein
MQSSSALVVLALAGLSFGQGGNFTLSCENVTLTISQQQQNSVLEGYCHTHSETTPYRTTTIDLNGCLGINQSTGALVWSYMYANAPLASACDLIWH